MTNFCFQFRNQHVTFDKTGKGNSTRLQLTALMRPAAS